MLLGLPLIWGPSATKSGRIKPNCTWSKPHVARDLRQIRKDALRVLVLSSSFTWEQRPGAMTGLEWELLERFAETGSACTSRRCPSRTATACW